MKRFKFYLTVLLIAATAVSCTKVIDLKLGNDTGKLVIEGNITNVNGPQYIKLSRNVAFTDNNSYPAVSGATVSVSDNNGKVYPFTEGPAGTYVAGLTSVPGNTYKMTVVTNGATYTASSVMPAVVTLDSLTFKKSEFNSTKDLRQITVHFKDPAGVVNQYRFVLFVNSVQVNAIFALNDDFSDGRHIDIDLVENDTDIHAGDTVTVEMECIDKPIYTYWFTLAQQTFNGPGGVAPSNPPTNISPAALGYFSAHTTQSQTIVVQ